MSLSKKFARAAGACFLGITMLAAAGCGPQTPAQQQTSAEQSNGVYADACVVVDQHPGYPYETGPWASYNAYDFRNGVVIFGTSSDGTMTRAAATVPLSQLNNSGKAHAAEMYNKLPEASRAKCEAPLPGPK